MKITFSGKAAAVSLSVVHTISLMAIQYVFRGMSANANRTARQEIGVNGSFLYEGAGTSM